MMIGVYFSGTGNTKHCVEKLVSLIDDAMLYNEFVHYADKELVTKDTKLVTKPAFEFIEFSKIEIKYKELFEVLINKCAKENTASTCI